MKRFWVELHYLNLPEEDWHLGRFRIYQRSYESALWYLIETYDDRPYLKFQIEYNDRHNQFDIYYT